MATGHGIEDEPIYGGEPVGGGRPDRSESVADDVLLRRDRQAEGHVHSVFNEPGYTITAEHEAPALIDRDWDCRACGFNLRGKHVGEPCPECGAVQFDRPEQQGEPGYAAWMAQQAECMTPLKSWLCFLGVALVGGPTAVIGTFAWAGITPALDPFSLLTAVVFAPILEEVMKVLAIGMLVELRPYVVRHRAQILVAAALAGLGFAAIENVLYLELRIPNPSPMLVLWRWTVCVALHAGCSLIVTSGIVRLWEQTQRTHAKPRRPLPFRELTIAAVIHGLYNALAIMLSWIGFL